MAMYHKVEKEKHRSVLKDIHQDTKIHRQEGNFSEKDAYHTTKMEDPHVSRELGYHSDGNSNGSSYGPVPSNRSRSSSPSSPRRSPSPETSSRYRTPSPPRRYHASSSRSRSP